MKITELKAQLIAGFITLVVLGVTVGTEISEAVQPETEFAEVIFTDVSDILMPVSEEEESRYEWQKLGYSSVIEYHEDLMTKQSEAVDMAEAAIEEYSAIITEEQEEQLRAYSDKMSTAVCFSIYNKNLEKFDEIVAECEEALGSYWASQSQASSYSSGGSYYSSGSGLTKSGGVYYYNGRKETWYSQRVLPGNGLNIPGRYVAEDGTIRDEDGYICVAASDLEYGSVVETSLGTGKVYDTGCAAGTTDIYVDW